MKTKHYDINTLKAIKKSARKAILDSDIKMTLFIAERVGRYEHCLLKHFNKVFLDNMPMFITSINEFVVIEKDAVCGDTTFFYAQHLPDKRGEII